MIGKTSSVTVISGRDGYPVEANTFNEMYVGIQNEEIGRIFLWNPLPDPIYGNYPSSPWTIGKKYEVILYTPPETIAKINLPAGTSGYKSCGIDVFKASGNKERVYTGTSTGLHSIPLEANKEYWVCVYYVYGEMLNQYMTTDLTYYSTVYNTGEYASSNNSMFDETKIVGEYPTITLSDTSTVMNLSGKLRSNNRALFKIKTADNEPQIAHLALDGAEVILFGDE